MPFVCRWGTPDLAIGSLVFQPWSAMKNPLVKPLALLLHEKLMPGSQLVSKFEALDFRVATIMEPAELAPSALKQMPMLVVADLTSRRGDVLGAIGDMLRQEATSHVPVIAYTGREDEKLRDAALRAGVRILATDATILPHLPQFVEHALLVE